MNRNDEDSIDRAATMLGGREPIVALSNVNMSFGPNQVLYNVSFAVAQGRSHSLLGRNGAASQLLFRSSPGSTNPTPVGSSSTASQPRRTRT